MVPDSCCKTVVPGCGRRDHASNIYKVEVGRWGLLSGLGCWVAPSPRRLEDSPPSAAPPPLQGGCITKLETFIQEHLRIIGAVGLGIACVQVCVWGGAGHGPCAGVCGLGIACVQVCVGGWASPVCRCGVHGGLGITRVRCVWGAGHRPCAGVWWGLYLARVRCVAGAVHHPCAGVWEELGIASVQMWCAWGAGHHPCAGLWGAGPRPCAMCVAGRG